MHFLWYKCPHGSFLAVFLIGSVQIGQISPLPYVVGSLVKVLRFAGASLLDVSSASIYVDNVLTRFCMWSARVIIWSLSVFRCSWNAVFISSLVRVVFSRLLFFLIDLASIFIVSKTHTYLACFNPI